MQPHDRQLAQIGRWPFFVAIFFTLLPLGAGPDGAAEGSTLRQFVWGIIFLSSALVFVRQSRRAQLAIDALPVTFLILLLYLAASIAWSPAPYVSFKRVVQVVGVVVIGASLVVGGAGQYRIHRLAPPVFLFGMLFAIAITAAFPGYAFSDIGLRAFMATKNNFGQFAVFAVIFALAYLSLEGRHKWLYLMLLGFGLVGLALSRSITAAMSLGAVALLYLTTRANKRASRSWSPILLGLAMITLLAINFAGIVFGYPSVQDLLELIFKGTGKDITLSGRTYLWELIWAEIGKHPWLGTGYGGFWLGLEGMAGQIAYLVRWGYPGQAHNGYLDILNELGVVGLILVLAFIAQHTLHLVRLAALDRPLALFHSTLLVALLTMNLAEATLLRTTHLWWIVFVASVFEVNAILQGCKLATVSRQTNTPAVEPFRREMT